jgi:hypothetical protein
VKSLIIQLEFVIGLTFDEGVKNLLECDEEEEGLETPMSSVAHSPVVPVVFSSTARKSMMDNVL